MAIITHPVAKQPYDKTLEENMSMYDKLPYKRDEEMCNASTLCMTSGNLVKYYRCQHQTEALEIATQDEHFKEITTRHQRRQEKFNNYLLEHFPTLYNPDMQEGAEEDTDYLTDENNSQLD